MKEISINMHVSFTTDADTCFIQTINLARRKMNKLIPFQGNLKHKSWQEDLCQMRLAVSGPWNLHISLNMCSKQQPMSVCVSYDYLIFKTSVGTYWLKCRNLCSQGWSTPTLTHFHCHVILWKPPQLPFCSLSAQHLVLYSIMCESDLNPLPPSGFSCFLINQCVLQLTVLYWSKSLWSGCILQSRD